MFGGHGSAFVPPDLHPERKDHTTDTWPDTTVLTVLARVPEALTLQAEWIQFTPMFGRFGLEQENRHITGVASCEPRSAATQIYPAKLPRAEHAH